MITLYLSCEAISNTGTKVQKKNEETLDDGDSLGVEVQPQKGKKTVKNTMKNCGWWRGVCYGPTNKRKDNDEKQRAAMGSCWGMQIPVGDG